MKMTRILMLAFAVVLSVGVCSCSKDNDGIDATSNNGGGGDNPGGEVCDVNWVDLGLPSGLLWADRNVGSSSPEDYGDYFAWGETAMKDNYDWDTYCYGTYYDQLSKYCNLYYFGINEYTDTLTILEPSDDAAAVNMGHGARIPTKEDWEELIRHTSTYYPLTTSNGIKGIRFTSANGYSIFLPCAGNILGEDNYGISKAGGYWCSSLNLYEPGSAWSYSFGWYDPCIEPINRVCGQSVRAVRSAQ